MRPRALLPAALLPLVFATACGGGGGSAAVVACEQFVEQRVGVPMRHMNPLDGASAKESGAGFVVRSAFTDLRTGTLTRYTCTVARDGDSWRLVDLTTDR